MTLPYPSTRFAKAVATATSGEDAVLTAVITVPDNRYGILYRMWVSIDVASEADLEVLLPVRPLVQVGFGASALWKFRETLAVEHTEPGIGATVYRTIRLGPFFYDFGPDGLYSRTMGENLTIAFEELGAGIKSKVSYQYALS